MQTEDEMATFRSVQLILLGLVLYTVAGCAAARRHDAKITGELLTAAGFTVDTANTPEPAADQDALPALKVVRQREGGATVYRLADPYACNCVSVGDADAYAQYQMLAHDREIVETTQLPATPP